MTNDDWEAGAGETCPRCQKEALRFRPRDGVCMPCAAWLDEKGERDRVKQIRFLKFRKEHNARIDRRKRKKKPSPEN